MLYVSSCICTALLQILCDSSMVSGQTKHGLGQVYNLSYLSCDPR
ncbi:putative lipoprotein [Anaplasma phagocytophilum str. ApNP]|uniref:Putative lipoprotein n=1 Tax=Anaplasma phagocytophilum str. ApNP TaxID=1359153 RepID=A0A0F3NF84_ANAPH|nr:putative lipoprotein [Anaplasma phagocytophilum str. ApNP]